LPPGPPVAGRGIAAGQLAPDFALDTLGEDGQTTFDDLLGKPLVLSFWTTWCPYCLRQTPVLVAAANGYAGDIRFVGIDVAEDAGVVAAYAAEHAIPYPVLLDRASQAAAAYAVNGFPTTYFLDASGHIIAHHIGSLSEAELKQYVEQLRRPRS
jgi:cytochrome c biogenesis protein CcmG/thiol:disulfide interchange protein DsbE